MITYLIKTILCLGLFWSFYTLFLEKEKIGQFKRFFLLGSLALSIVLPLITVTHIIPAPITSENYLLPNVILQNGVSNSTPIWTYLLIAGYLIISFFLSYRFIKQLNHYFRTIREHDQIPGKRIRFILLNYDAVPHTFLQYIFLPKHLYVEKRIDPRILEHEKAHALQWHTLDILLIELCKSFLWFNPFIYLIKKSMRLNHEFLADERPLQFSKTKDYQRLLFSIIESNSKKNLAHYINHSITKKRLIMMTRKTSPIHAITKIVLSLMVIALSIFIFPKVVYAQEDPVSSKDLERYIKIIEKNYDRATGSISLRGSDAKTVSDIYPKLSAAQKELIESKGLPVIGPPPPPPPPPAPIEAEPALPAPPAPLPPTPPSPETKPTDVQAPYAPAPTKATKVPVPPPPPPPAPPVIEEGATYYLNQKKVDYEAVEKEIQKVDQIHIRYDENSNTYYLKSGNN